MQYGFPSYTGNYGAPAYQAPTQYSPYAQQQPQTPSYGGYGGGGYGQQYGQNSQNLLSLLLGSLGGIPGYGSQGAYGNNMPQYPPVNYPPVYQPTYQQPAQTNINVAATSPFGSASSIGSAIGGNYAATNGSAYTNYYGAGAQGSSVAYGQMPSYGANPYGGYGGGYGGGYTPTQTYSQSIANGMTQYQPSYPSYPPVSMPPVLPPAPQPIYNYGSSLTSAVAGPGAYANGTAGTV